jgi:glucan biosynthesis protein C
MAQTLLSRPTPVTEISARTAGKGPARLLYIDNLRWVMIMLVVSMHAACTYSHLGSWYYMEDSPVSVAETGIFATYQATLQSFFMGFLFFIAGYFVPGAYDKKGAAKFVRDRAFRLGLPLLFFVFVLQPVAVYCIGLFHGEDVAPRGFADLYARYIINSRWLGGTGPLWFCEALLIFCLGYALFRAFRPGSNSQHPADPELRRNFVPRPSSELRSSLLLVRGVRILRHSLLSYARNLRPSFARSSIAFAPLGYPAKRVGILPGKLKIWGLIVAITLLTFIVRFPWPNGTAFYNLQFCYFSQYVLYFCAGTLAFRGDWLDRFSVGSGKYWGRVALIGGLIGWVALLVLGGAFKGQLPAYRGGWHWQSLGMAFWESMTGTAISMYLIVWFREKFNRQGRAARFFSANAFAVYVFHTPVLISISRMMSRIHGPLLLKFAFLTLISIAVTYALCSILFRKLPLLRDIL